MAVGVVGGVGGRVGGRLKLEADAAFTGERASPLRPKGSAWARARVRVKGEGEG